MNMRGKISLIALGTIFCGAQAGLADTISGLLNTGVSDPATLIADKAMDPAYSLDVVSPVAGNGQLTPAQISALSFTAPTYVTDQTNFMFTSGGPYWVPDSTSGSPLSKWISPQPSYSAPSYDPNPADFVFQTTFTYTGLHAGAEIDGAFAADNSLIEIIFNGAVVGIYGPPSGGASQDSGFTPFTISSGFLESAGGSKNTLDFVVLNYGPQNSGNPAGIQIQMSGIAGAKAVPLPASAFGGSMLLGLLVAAKVRSRKNAV